MIQNNEMIDLSEYPKNVLLVDGTQLTLRPCRSDDRGRLFRFFKDLPQRDRRFFKHDVSSKKTIDYWCDNLDYDLTLPILALSGKGNRQKVVGNATLHTERHGWSVHVGRVRAQVAPEMRKRGLGKLLMREMCDRASMRGIDKVQTHVRKDNKDGARLLRQLGFRKEGVYRRHAKDLRGRRHDVVIYYQDLEDLWRKMEDMNLDLDSPSMWP